MIEQSVFTYPPLRKASEKQIKRINRASRKETNTCHHKSQQRTSALN